MMTLTTIGQQEARRALETGLSMAQSRSLAMAFAVADRFGDLVLCERMDGAPSRILTHAIRKAYTSAEMGRDTAVFARQLQERGGDLLQWGDARLTTLTGGCAIVRDGEVIGAVGCGGAPTAVDAEIAAAMAAAALG